MFNQSQLLTLREIIKKKITYSSRSRWLIEFAENSGIGKVERGNVSFDVKAIETLEGYLSDNAIPIEIEHQDFEDRITTAAHIGNEKVTHNEVTHNRVLVVIPNAKFTLDNQVMPNFRAIDMTVDEVLSLKASQLIVIENLLTFLRVGEYSEFNELFDREALYLFRGMRGCYSTSASKLVLKAFLGEKGGYFDFDPAGISLINHHNYDFAVLPNLADLKRVQASGNIISDPDKYFTQNLHNDYERLTPHISLMRRHHLALSQEYLHATEFPLHKITLT